MDEVVSLTNGAMDAMFARTNASFEMAARSTEGQGLDWQEGVNDAQKLREFGSVLRATGGNADCALDLTFADADDDVEAGGGGSQGVVVAAAAAAAATAATSTSTPQNSTGVDDGEQALLDSVN